MFSTTHLPYQQFLYINSKVAAELSGLQYCSKNFPWFSCPSSVHTADNARPCQIAQTEGSLGLKRTHDPGRMSRQGLWLCCGASFAGPQYGSGSSSGYGMTCTGFTIDNRHSTGGSASLQSCFGQKPSTNSKGQLGNGFLSSLKMRF